MARTSDYPVLIVDDEPQFLQSVAITLRVAGFDVTSCAQSAEVLSLIAARAYGAVVLDILMPGIAGTALLPEILQQSPQTRVIMLTAVNDVETAVGCMRNGAFDYLVKPVEKDRLVTTVRRALDIVDLSNENRLLKNRLLDNRLESPACFEHIVTRDRRMNAIFQYIEAVAPSNMPVLIQGETGTGKELVARAIHLAGGKPGEFVCVNAAGLNDTLFSDTLFGHNRGAFTGADSRRDGLVAKAAGGTLFLDEIGDLPIESQVKLLRLLEEHTYYPVGSDTQKVTDARFVVATNHDLAQRKKDGAFRSDLYYRLEAHRIDLPPLRERKDDIMLLAETFTEEAARGLQKEPPEIPDSVAALLLAYSFPGNVRELKNRIVDAVSIAKGATLDESYFIGQFALQGERTAQLPDMDEPARAMIARMQQLPALKATEQLLIDEALRRAGGNQTIAAQSLGMTRSALNKRLTRAKSEEQEG